MRRFRVPFGILLVSLLGACSSTPEHVKPQVLPEIDRPLAVRELWRQTGAATGVIVLQPAVSGSTVVAADGSERVRRYRIGDRGDSLSEVWRSASFSRLSGGVAADARLVVIGTLKGEVLALAADDGKVLWRSSLGSEIIAPAAISGDIVVVRSGDNRLHGLDAATGQRKWSYQRSIPALSVRGTAAPVVVDQLVFAGFPGGKVVAVNLATGVAVWEGTVSMPKGSNELERISDVVAAPVIGAREVCAVAHQGRLACFDLSRGSLLWAKDVSSAVGLALDNRAVYVTDDKGVVHAFDRASGGSLWKQDKLVNRPLSAPLIRQEHLVVADGKGFVHVLAREDGALRGRLEIGGGAVTAPLQALESGTLIQTQSGTLLAVQAD